MDRVTHDDILYGRLTLWQPVDGPRAAMDTVLLAAWVRLRARRPRFVELGAAAGAVSLMLALRFPGPFTITGVELQPGLVRLAERNRAESGLEDRVSFLCGDLRDPALLPAESFDGLAVNPPYDAPVKAATEKTRGRLSAIPSRSIARQGATGPFPARATGPFPARATGSFPAGATGPSPTNHGEVCCTLDDIASAASRLLKGHGRLFAVFRTDRLAAFVGSMLGHRLAPKRLLMVHPRRESPSNLFLIECVKGGGEGLTVAPPLIVMGEDGKYTPDLLRAYGPEGL